MNNKCHIGWKTLWEKEKLLVTSNFFSHNVFHSYISLVHQNAVLCGNGFISRKLANRKTLWPMSACTFHASCVRPILFADASSILLQGMGHLHVDLHSKHETEIYIRYYCSLETLLQTSSTLI